MRPLLGIQSQIILFSSMFQGIAVADLPRARAPLLGAIKRTPAGAYARYLISVLASEADLAADVQWKEKLADELTSISLLPDAPAETRAAAAGAAAGLRRRTNRQ